MAFQSGGSVGIQNNADGATNTVFRQGKQGEQMVSELHGRFYEQTYRGNVYTGGISNTALASTNAIATGLTSSATPVIGLYNPANSGVNLVILQASIVETTIAATAVAPGGFMWVGSAGNPSVSTGTLGINKKSLVTGGGQGKFFAVSTALTGLTNNLVALAGTGFGGINAAGPATAITQPQNNTVENVDGAWIVPPGGVLGIMNQISTTTVSVTVSISWEEVPV